MKKLFIAVLALSVFTTAVYAKTKEHQLIKDNRLTEAVIANDVKKVKKLSFFIMRTKYKYCILCVKGNERHNI